MNNQLLTKYLFLLRHGQSEPGLYDSKRNLTEKGITDIKNISETFFKTIATNNEMLPKIIMVSPVNRTMQTLKYFKENIKTINWLENENYKIKIYQEIYASNVKKIIQIIEENINVCNSILYIGHNPAISELVTCFSNPQNKKMARFMSPADLVHLETNCQQMPNNCQIKGQYH